MHFIQLITNINWFYMYTVYDVNDKVNYFIRILSNITDSVFHLHGMS